MRTLTSEEIKALEQNHCISQDWQQITVSEDFAASNIYNVEFIGKCQIGATNGTLNNDIGIDAPAGIHNKRRKNQNADNNR